MCHVWVFRIVCASSRRLCFVIDGEHSVGWFQQVFDFDNRSSQLFIAISVNMCVERNEDDAAQMWNISIFGWPFHDSPIKQKKTAVKQIDRKTWFKINFSHLSFYFLTFNYFLYTFLLVTILCRDLLCIYLHEKLLVDVTNFNAHINNTYWHI